MRCLVKISAFVIALQDQATAGSAGGFLFQVSAAGSTNPTTAAAEDQDNPSTAPAEDQASFLEEVTAALVGQAVAKVEMDTEGEAVHKQQPEFEQVPPEEFQNNPEKDPFLNKDGDRGHAVTVEGVILKVRKQLLKQTIPRTPGKILEPGELVDLIRNRNSYYGRPQGDYSHIFDIKSRGDLLEAVDLESLMTKPRVLVSSNRRRIFPFSNVCLAGPAIR